MKTITYDELTITLKAVKDLNDSERREVRQISMAILADTQAYIEDELIPPHLKKKVKVIVQ